MNESNTHGWLSGFLIGVVVGAGTALLLAPHSGEKTRTMLTEKGVEVRDKAMNTLEETRGRVEDFSNDVADEVRDRVEKLKDVGQRVGKQEARILKKGAKDARQALQ
jgi:gas vesicle protein